MKKLKNLFALALCALMLFCLACSAAPADKPADKPLKIGVILLTEHAALQAACDGFTDAIRASGLNAEIDIQNAQGEQTVCATIATKFVSDEVDLILAIATPAAQAAAQATRDIPILVTAVTDPASAKLVASNEAPGGNVSGTSDMNPVKEQAELLQKLVPSAKTVGIMYHSSEDNSILQADMAKAALEALGMSVEIFTCADGTEVQAVATRAAESVDALYLPTDNLMADTIATIAMVCTPAGVPIICGESNQVLGGGTATFGIDYYKLGSMTGAQAIRILKDGANIAEMPIEYSGTEELELTVNEEAIAALGLTVPEDLK